MSVKDLANLCVGITNILGVLSVVSLIRSVFSMRFRFGKPFVLILVGSREFFVLMLLRSEKSFVFILD